MTVYGDMDHPLDTQESVLSPSDFGFHNALLGPDGKLCFIDFEYAGWDDPAKLICDFFCQPQTPVPQAHLGFICQRADQRPETGRRTGGAGEAAPARVRDQMVLHHAE